MVVLGISLLKRPSQRLRTKEKAGSHLTMPNQFITKLNQPVLYKIDKS
jgi:hypothetical protein